MEAHGITSPSIDKPTFDTDDLCSAQEMHNWREKTFATASRVMFFLILPAWFFSIIQANNYSSPISFVKQNHSDAISENRRSDQSEPVQT